MKSSPEINKKDVDRISTKKKIKDKSESYKYDILRIEDFWVFNIKNWRPEEYPSSKIKVLNLIH
jgi:hypothetical protein